MLVNEYLFESGFPGRSLGDTSHCNPGYLQVSEYVRRLLELSPATIDQQQIRKYRILALQAGITPFDGSSQRSIIVACAYPCDVESSIVRLSWPILVENDTGRDGGFASGMTHVEALYSCGHLLQIEQLLQRIELSAQVRTTGNTLLQCELGVVGRHRDPSSPITTYVAANPDLSPCLFPNGSFQHIESRK